MGQGGLRALAAVVAVVGFGLGSCATASNALNLTLLTDGVDELGARCLDGSPGGYYWRAGSAANATKFLLVFNGGGWCYSLEDCAARAKTNLGTSTLFETTIQGDGITKNDPGFNPDFSSWNVAYLYYCDGTSYGGNHSEPVQVGDQTLFFRGLRILEAFLDHLQRHRGLDSATEVFLSGHSAGGLGTYMHADYVGSRVPAGALFGAIPDAGFFMMNNTVGGRDLYPAQIQNISRLASVVGDADCMAANAAEAWRCMATQHALPFVSTRLHMIQSSYDSWQLSNIFDVSCTPKYSNNTCSANQMDQFQAVHTTILGQIRATNSTRHAVWSDSCIAHSQAYYGDYFNNPSWQMSARMFTPTNQKLLTNIAVVRQKKGGKRFEIACFKNKVLSWRNKVEKDIDEVLQIHTVYTNVSKGEVAKNTDLQKAYGTDDHTKICRIILDKGELQVSKEERDAQLGALFKEVATIVADKCIDPATERPYTAAQIERAMRDIHVSVKPTASAKAQALDVIKKLAETISIARASMSVRVRLPQREAKRVKPLVLPLTIALEHEDWDDDLELECTIDPGTFRALTELVGHETKGQGLVEILSVKNVAEGDEVL
ncbi:uncharacterized protein MONBRDRAFT_38375 [Monosiga brevicollis MX1]|uniref:Pectin acetylesterase n=1 Tax=Monosiga brevicollis TaxID=81824 RepID=A9V7B2_MONBE|nr:uncharacterized protein MONBRDRAFT_38375 [Monosiga brevicollis MX1]EDQ86486.1 predicted protein [Monosiga brevicollis MX1]|eukprot:XP_001748599.1 hypothetical protein [Monosiga brevicollis MX1]